MNYLVLRFHSLGNVAMTVPVIASLAERYPEHTFVVVAQKRLHDMFAGYANVEFVEVSFAEGKWEGLKHIYHTLKQKPIDGIIDLQDDVYTRTLRKMLHKRHMPVSVFKKERWKKFLAWSFLKRKSPLHTEFERYSQAFAAIGLQADDTFEHIPIQQEYAEECQQLFGDKKGYWIGIAPFAKYKSNVLGVRKTKEIIAHFAHRKDTHIFLFGANKIECERLKQWATIYPNTTSVAGRLSLGVELELMRRLDIMLCMDSANQHLASLVGLPCVSVWCATHPIFGFKAWKQDNDNVIQLPISCRPCRVHGTNHCRYGNFSCQNIESKRIIERIEYNLVKK